MLSGSQYSRRSAATGGNGRDGKGTEERGKERKWDGNGRDGRSAIFKNVVALIVAGLKMPTPSTDRSWVRPFSQRSSISVVRRLSSLSRLSDDLTSAAMSWRCWNRASRAAPAAASVRRRSAVAPRFRSSWLPTVLSRCTYCHTVVHTTQTHTRSSHCTDRSIWTRVLHGSGSRNVPRESRGISRRIGIEI